MQFEIVQMEDLSGDAAKVYSVMLEGEEYSLLEQFVLDNGAHKKEIQEMFKHLSLMGHRYGCKPHYFKEGEGSPGDGMVALRFKQMRLYCLRFDNTCIFVGGGGYKPPGIAAYQENDALNRVAQQMRLICASINNAIIEKDLIILQDGSLEMTDFINLEI